MVRWISKVKIRDKISSDSFLNEIYLKNLDITLQANRLHCFDHVCGSDGWIKKRPQHEAAGK